MADLIQKCVLKAKEIDECCAFAINKDFGVHFYDSKCYGLDTDDQNQWVTYELTDINIKPKPPAAPPRYEKVTELTTSDCTSCDHMNHYNHWNKQ